MDKYIDKCFVIERHRFLGWRWDKKYYEHDWAYTNKEKRKCLKCGQVEIYFGRDYHDGYSIEDWRKKI